MLEYFERVSQFMSDEREQLIVCAPVLVADHQDPQVTVAVSGRDERQETPVQVPERAVPELDVDHAVRTGNRIDERSAEFKKLRVRETAGDLGLYLRLVPMDFTEGASRA
jgi:hypothetical protein